MQIKRILLIGSVIFLASGCGSREETKAPQRPSSQQLVQQGMQFLSDGDVLRAVQNFDAAIKVDPRNVQNYLVLGQVYFRLKQFDRAASTYEAATRVEPASGEAFYFLAASRALQGPEMRGEAIKAAKHSAEIFYQKQDEERFKQSVALVKNLTDNLPPVEELQKQ